ncbi:MAG: sulfotransferase domain-containing protein, partial [Planctomycetota bacterium]
MRFPDFLIIGAAKAGTTSLYRDLRANPGVFMPREKEAGNLIDDDVLTDRGRAAYAGLFAAARPGQVCGEAPTDYTKLPDHPGVPGRALEVIGPGLRCVYLVREPVSRIMSYHNHHYAGGRMPRDIDQALKEFPELIQHTRYAMQITPWIDTFGRHQVLIVRFEDYTSDRRTTVSDVTRFIGAEPRPDLVRVDTVYNKGDGKPVMRGPMVRVRFSPVYTKLVRPLLPLAARDTLRRLLLPKAPPRPDPPSPDTVDFILDQLRD